MVAYTLGGVGDWDLTGRRACWGSCVCLASGGLGILNPPPAPARLLVREQSGRGKGDQEKQERLHRAETENQTGWEETLQENLAVLCSQRTAESAASKTP